MEPMAFKSRFELGSRSETTEPRGRNPHLDGGNIQTTPTSFLPMGNVCPADPGCEKASQWSLQGLSPAQEDQGI